LKNKEDKFVFLVFLVRLYVHLKIDFRFKSRQNINGMMKTSFIFCMYALIFN